MFIPKRLEIDLELTALQTNSITSIAHTTLDTSKIVIMKSSKEKK